MKRFKKILFVADGSKGEKLALARAIDLAESNKAKLTLMDVLGFEVEASVEKTTRLTIHQLHKELLADRRNELRQMRQSILSKHAGLRVAVEVESGKAAVAVIRSVLRHGHDLVLKAPEGQSNKLARLFGGTDLKLMRKCPCPVWLAKPSRRRRYRKILAAVDLNPVEAETQSLAHQVMEISISLARFERSELHVVHVWRLAGEAKLRGRQVTTARVDKLLHEIRDAHATELKSLIEEHQYEQTTVHLLKGRAGDIIPAAVNELDADLIVLGTVGRAGIPGFFIGNTAEKVLGSVNCSVLTLKPEGFETPIQV
jgi:nucleotide-binding universal stress UspA family protein